MYCICTQYLVGAHFALITASIFHGMEVISSLKYVNLCTQYLVGAPLAQIPASVRCGMEAISLWHRFSLENIPYGVQVRHVGLPIQHSNIMVSKALGSGFGSVARC